MPKTTTVTVQQDSNGYYNVRIPKAIGDAMELAGEKVEVQIESGKKISLEKEDS